MAVTAANVLVGTPPSGVGGIYGAASGTTLPTTTVAALDPAFADGGYVSEDGVTQAIGSDVTEIKAWNGDTVRKIETSHDVTLQFTLLETSTTTRRWYYGNATSSLSEVRSGQGIRQAWVIDMVDGAKKIRLVVPDGQVTERGDVVYRLDEAVAYPITITAYPDSSGVKIYKYVS